ncbi:MAG: sirohydrochlorin nickelochelatase [Methanobacteriaceae archaeon]|nr:sirohydrochlorin nickelochelatase [Candidatus Methanorudis spinitermitis]
MKSNKGSSMKEKIGVLLISHGSRLPESTKTINELANMYREYTDFKVEIAYMELRKPSIPTALDNLVKNTEIDTVIAVPVFLSHGMHTTRDIPKILGIASDDTNEDLHNHHDNHKHSDEHNHGHNHHHDFKKVNFDGKIIYTEPLGADPLLVEIIKNRVDNALND